MALSLSALDLYWNLDCLCVMGKDRPTFDATSADRRRAFKFFVVNFRDFCIMEDYINPAKPLDSEDYWITAKRPKAMAALRQAFPQAEWDVLTTTIVSQISDDEKQNPAQWLTKLSQHYLGGEPLMQSTHNFLRMLKQEPGMSIQAWHTLVRLEYQKCNFPAAADDRLQRDIFVIGLNDSFRHFRSDIISREDLTSLTFAQVISKARDLEASIQSDSAITQQHLDEAAHQITSNGNKSKWPSRPSRRPTPPASGNAQSNPCIWCGRAPHANRRDCPASKDICHGCGKRGHWQQVCKASSARMVIVLLRILTVTLSHPLTTSHMMYIKSHLHLRESLWTLISVLLHSHHVLNGSDSRLTLAALVTLYMSQTSTSSPLYKWTHLLSASLTTQRQSSQLQGKLHYSALVVGKHMSL